MGSENFAYLFEIKLNEKEVEINLMNSFENYNGIKKVKKVKE
jgi:hypothetical protein